MPCKEGKVMIKLLTLAAMSAAINSSFGRVSSFTGATFVLAMTKVVWLLTCR